MVCLLRLSRALSAEAMMCSTEWHEAGVRQKGKSYRDRLQAGHRASPADSASHQELPER